MEKNKNSFLHNSVRKLQKRSGEILTREEIHFLLSGGTSSRASQEIYALKGQGILMPIRNGLYYVQGENPISLEQILHTEYWAIAKKIITEQAGREAIIGGEKSLELHLRDTLPPEVLIVYTSHFSAQVTLSDRYAIHFRTMKTGSKTASKNAFPLFRRMSEKMEIDGENFLILSREASLLDSLTIRSRADGISDALILRFLKRFASTISAETLAKITEYRGIRAMNRLRTLTKKAGYEDLYKITLAIIQREGGGCFVSF